jgi:hypothetical protein
MASLLQNIALALPPSKSADQGALSVLPSPGAPTCKRPLHVEGILCSERYAQRIHCAGKTLLFTRLEYFKKDGKGQKHYVELYRTATDSSALRFGPPTSLGSLLGHGVEPAIACTDSDQLVWFAASTNNGGIYRRMANLTSAGFAWIAEWEHILSAKQSESGCVELRKPFLQDNPGRCALDSKLNVVRLPSGAWMLFARANLAPMVGGRHVQAAISSVNGSFAGSRFQLLRIPGFANATLGAAAEHLNIYYFAATWVRHGSPIRDALMGCFPGNAGGEAGVFCTTSDDGLVWQRPRLLLPSVMHDSDRTADHPLLDDVGARPLPLATRGVTLAIEHGVQVPDSPEEDETAKQLDVRLARHRVPNVWLDPGADAAGTEDGPDEGEIISLDCFTDATPSFCEYHCDVPFEEPWREDGGAGRP